MITLGIETSCDETAVALFDSTQGLLHEAVYSQIDLHADFGGVVPELASRDHCRKLLEILSTGTNNFDLTQIDRIAYTAGPGLLGALIVGEAFAQGLALALNKPLIPVNHLEAHVLAPFLDFQDHDFPFTCLLVSGGHSLIIDAQKFESYKIIGQSLDDAIGEAFDKVAKLMHLGYPGGPMIEQKALDGDPKKYVFPRPMLHSGTLDMSFSGLKTAVLYEVQKINDLPAEIPHIAASFQQAAFDVLEKKIVQSFLETGNETLVLAGGVAANKTLRQRMSSLQEALGVKVLYPPIKHCTDNAAMIAYLGSLKDIGKNDYNSSATAKWPLNMI